MEVPKNCRCQRRSGQQDLQEQKHAEEARAGSQKPQLAYGVYKDNGKENGNFYNGIYIGVGEGTPCYRGLAVTEPESP